MTRIRHKTTGQRVLEALRGVDWVRVAQRASTFIRDFRGDDPRDIHDDHLSELERSQRLRRAAQEVGTSSTRSSARRSQQH